MKKIETAIFWMRRDLRLEDNLGLIEALNGQYPVLPIFIFDAEITDELPRSDPRITFIHELLQNISSTLREHSSDIYIKQGDVEQVWNEIIEEFDVKEVYTNEDYEPYAIQRDDKIRKLLSNFGIPFHQIKDQVIFAKNEVLKNDNTPYTVYGPYRNKWLKLFDECSIIDNNNQDEPNNYLKIKRNFPNISELGFNSSAIKVLPYSLKNIDSYAGSRDYPSNESTSKLGPFLRFGAVSIRQIVSQAKSVPVFLNQLIWREFFMQILYHFPNVVTDNFKSTYDKIEWRNNEEEFERWTKGETGYSLVDAGMKELNSTGYMHNRVRMVTASFLCKHLLIDWRWGESYFASKLLDYELASNNGNWQWVAGTGCDAAPYFRVFNPIEQAKKFDPEMVYRNKYLGDSNNQEPIVDHKYARERALITYKKGLKKNEAIL